MKSKDIKIERDLWTNAVGIQFVHSHRLSNVLIYCITKLLLQPFQFGDELIYERKKKKIKLNNPLWHITRNGVRFWFNAFLSFSHGKECCSLMNISHKQPQRPPFNSRFFFSSFIWFYSIAKKNLHQFISKALQMPFSKGNCLSIRRNTSTKCSNWNNEIVFSNKPQPVWSNRPIITPCAAMEWRHIDFFFTFIFCFRLLVIDLTTSLFANYLITHWLESHNTLIVWQLWFVR